LAIFPRTLEVFDMAGVVDPFLACANRVASVAFIAQGRQLATMQVKPEGTPYAFAAMVPQDVTEKLLAESLVRRGGKVEYETAFIAASEQGNGVSATLDHKRQKTSLTATYVVGCDGAHSAVRHLLNLPFEGAEYKDTFMLADVESNDVLPVDEMQLCPSEREPVAIFPMSATRRRIIATIQQTVGDVPSLDLVRSVLAERGPQGFEVRSLNWSTYFRIHHRQVSELRSGRFFIAGDAAHIHSPFGGQGMNTGLQDIWNLVWKLELVIGGHASEDLLDTYTAERRPVIKGVIEITDFMTKGLGTPSKLAQLLRNAIIPAVSRLAPFQHAFVKRLSELGIAYKGSPIVEGPGERYWDDSLRGGEQIKSRFLLVVGDGVEQATKEEARRLSETWSSVVELRSHSGHEITLVRPDGYIAHQGRSTAALSTIGSLLQRQAGLDAAA
jgi:2-polyprenyl-6-methoxyphenol hydroxylase-like FAD-dependent oxidoreductase